MHSLAMSSTRLRTSQQTHSPAIALADNSCKLRYVRTTQDRYQTAAGGARAHTLTKTVVCHSCGAGQHTVHAAIAPLAAGASRWHTCHAQVAAVAAAVAAAAAAVAAAVSHRTDKILQAARVGHDVTNGHVGDGAGHVAKGQRGRHARDHSHARYAADGPLGHALAALVRAAGLRPACVCGGVGCCERCRGCWGVLRRAAGERGRAPRVRRWRLQAGARASLAAARTLNCAYFSGVVSKPRRAVKGVVMPDAMDAPTMRSTIAGGLSAGTACGSGARAQQVSTHAEAVAEPAGGACSAACRRQSCQRTFEPRVCHHVVQPALGKHLVQGQHARRQLGRGLHPACGTGAHTHTHTPHGSAATTRREGRRGASPRL